MSFLESSYHAFGLDIGGRSIKAVELKLNRYMFGAPRLELHAWNEVQVPDGVFSPGAVNQPEAAAKLLRTVVDASTPKSIKTKAVVMSLPETTTFVKTIEIPKVDSEHIAAEIIKEAEKHIPLPLSEATLDWQLLAPLDEEATMMRAIVAAAPKLLVENFSTALEQAGFTTLAVEIEAIAIVRGLLLEELIPGDEAIAILDLGASRSSIIIYDYGTIQLSTSLAYSGDNATARIAEKLSISMNEAEKFKLACGLEPGNCDNKVRLATGAILTELVREIRTIIRSYREKNPDAHPIGQLILTGGAATTAKLDSYLSQKLLTRVRRGNPIKDFYVPPSFPLSRAASFTTAIGLARRAERFLPAEASGQDETL